MGIFIFNQMISICHAAQRAEVTAPAYRQRQVLVIRDPLII